MVYQPMIFLCYYSFVVHIIEIFGNYYFVKLSRY